MPLFFAGYISWVMVLLIIKAFAMMAFGVFLLAKGLVWVIKEAWWHIKDARRRLATHVR